MTDVQQKTTRAHLISQRAHHVRAHHVVLFVVRPRAQPRRTILRAIKYASRGFQFDDSMTAIIQEFPYLFPYE